jgi:hypothetical protein
MERNGVGVGGVLWVNECGVDDDGMNSWCAERRAGVGRRLSGPDVITSGDPDW